MQTLISETQQRRSVLGNTSTC